MWWHYSRVSFNSIEYRIICCLFQRTSKSNKENIEKINSVLTSFFFFVFFFFDLSKRENCHKFNECHQRNERQSKMNRNNSILAILHSSLRALKSNWFWKWTENRCVDSLHQRFFFHLFPLCVVWMIVVHGQHVVVFCLANDKSFVTSKER